MKIKLFFGLLLGISNLCAIDALSPLKHHLWAKPQSNTNPRADQIKQWYEKLIKLIPKTKDWYNELTGISQDDFNWIREIIKYQWNDLFDNYMKVAIPAKEKKGYLERLLNQVVKYGDKITTEYLLKYEVSSNPSKNSKFDPLLFYTTQKTKYHAFCTISSENEAPFVQHLEDAEKVSVQIAKLLIKYGAEIKESDLTLLINAIKNNEDQEIADQYGNTLWLPNIALAKLMIDKGVAFDSKAGYMQNLLKGALLAQDLSFIRALVQKYKVPLPDRLLTKTLKEVSAKIEIILQNHFRQKANYIHLKNLGKFLLMTMKAPFDPRAEYMQFFAAAAIVRKDYQFLKWLLNRNVPAGKTFSSIMSGDRYKPKIRQLQILLPR